MEPLQIKQASLLDILFENKNKAYGAYVLRQSYHTSLWKALGLATLGAAIIIYALVVTMKTDGQDVPFGEEIILRDLTTPKKPDAPKEKPKDIIKTETPKGTPALTMVFKEPKMTAMPNVNTTPLDNDNMDNTSAKPNNKGFENGTPNVTKPSDSLVISKPEVVVVPKQPEEKLNLTQREQRPQGWIPYLQRALAAPTNRAAEDNCPPGRYRIVVNFEVDENGNPSHTKVVESDVEYGLPEAAQKVILNGPKWIPGMNSDGEKVKSIQQTAIVFEIQEG
jgi:periplasmic protein TonB